MLEQYLAAHRVMLDFRILRDEDAEDLMLEFMDLVWRQMSQPERNDASYRIAEG